MQPDVAAVTVWSKLNFMNINCKKSKEMIIGPLCKEPESPLSITCECVTVFKLLGIMVNSSLTWDDRIDYITTRAAKRLRFQQKLKRAGLLVDDLVHYYEVVVRPVLKYACPVWHYSLTEQQTKTVEDVQRRAVRIFAGNIPYSDACESMRISSLADR